LLAISRTVRRPQAEGNRWRPLRAGDDNRHNGARRTTDDPTSIHGGAMSRIDAPTIFFDVGGVLLTNAWDTPARERAVKAFQLEETEFQTRHGMLKTAFETGRLSLEAYIRKAVFYRSRPFSPEDFLAFMYTQSQPLGETLEWVRALAETG